MILYLASAIIFIFVCLSLFYKADISLGFKIAGCALILFASLKYAIYEFLGGAFFAPTLPRVFLLFMEAIYGALLLLFFLLLLWDLYLAGNWLLNRAGIPVPKHLPVGPIKCGLVFLALCGGIWGTWQAVKVPQPRIIELKVPNLPPALVGFRVAQLSDLHIGQLLRKDWLAEVVQRVNALDPDLIALTGDYVDGRVADLEAELAPLADLHARYGVFAVTGNHEYYWNAREWSDALKKMPLTLLNNEHRALDINGQNLIIAGLPDLIAERFGHEAPDIQKALANAPEGIKILLAHQPKKAREYTNFTDIILSGHTHGGLMFFLEPLIARFNGGFVRGLYHTDGKILHVSPGTGLWNGFSSRIGVPSEITCIILTGK